MDIPKYFPSLQNAAALQDVWKEFWRIFTTLEAPDDTIELEWDIKNWVDLFLKQYQTKNVTPYIHAFAHHVPEFIQRYGSICKFNQQGLEKLNDLTTQHYLRGTNHRELEALTQVMQKRNRMEELENNGYKRSQRKNHCSICGSSKQVIERLVHAHVSAQTLYSLLNVTFVNYLPFGDCLFTLSHYQTFF